MRKLMIAIVLSVFSIGASANNLDCNLTAELAEKIMNVRQTGVSQEYVEELVSSKPTMLPLVYAAYKVDMQDTEEAKDKVSKMFKEAIYDACVKSNSV